MPISVILVGLYMNITLLFLEHLYNIRVGNISLTLTKMDREIAVVTLTQFDISFIPNFTRESYKMNVKVEGLIIEGASLEEHLVPIISSQHLSTSPAYFFKAELEKMNPGSLCSHQLICSLSSVEIVYHKVSEKVISSRKRHSSFFHHIM